MYLSLLLTLDYKTVVIIIIIITSSSPGPYPSTTLEELLEPFTLESVECFLQSLYKGRVEEAPHFSHTLQMYRISRLLQVTWVVEELVSFIQDTVSCQTVFETLSLALEYEDPVLTCTCERLLSRNLLGNVTSPADDTWWEMPREIVLHVLSLVSLKAESEIEVFIYVLYWIERNITVSNRYVKTRIRVSPNNGDQTPFI